MYNLTETFEANGQAWKTDAETLKLMREFKASGNTYMVSVVFHIGLDGGRIVKAVL